MLIYTEMEATEEKKVESKEVVVVVPSKKIQINSIDHELAKPLVESSQEAEAITAIKIEGNSYSLEFS